MEKIGFFNPLQIAGKTSILIAIYRHYGFDFDPESGIVTPIKGATQRNLPDFRNLVKLRTAIRYAWKYASGVSSIKFFDSVINNAFGNINEVTQGDQRLMVVTGLRIMQGAGAGDAAISALAPAVLAEEEFINAKVKFEMNGNIIFEDQPLGTLVANATGTVNGYFEFPQVEVLEPSSSMKLSIELAGTMTVSSNDKW